MDRVRFGFTVAWTIACAALLGGCATSKPGGPAGMRPALVAALGDSITAGSPLWDPDPRVRDGLGTAVDPESAYEYWAQVDLGSSAIFRNCGIFGERTDEIAARLDGCARGADILIVQGGINDLAQGRAPAAAGRYLAGMVERGKALHQRVLLAEVLPWNNGTARQRDEIRELNATIGAIGRREGVVVLPFYRALEDPAHPGRMRRRLTGDGDHPSVAGYRLLGAVVAEKLADLV